MFAASGVTMRALLLGDRAVPWSSVERVALATGTIPTVVIELAGTDETWAIDLSQAEAKATLDYAAARGVRTGTR